MKRGAHQKIKLLYLWELLKRETDEDHPLPTGALLQALEQVGITCDRRTLARDIEDLNSWGFEVMSVMQGHERAYYVEDRLFSLPELRILMDAVQGTQTLTERKSRELREKLASVSGSYGSSRLKGNSLLHNGHKQHNEVVYYTVDTLEKAIWEDTKVSFLYFRRNEKGEKVYEGGGYRYLADPIATVMKNGRHYLMALCPLREEITVFRVDRMDDVAQEGVQRDPRAKELKADAEEYTGISDKMFAGKICQVTLEFTEELIPSMLDRFGDQFPITSVSGNVFQGKASVMLSPTFWGWLFQYQDKIRLIHPPEAVEEVRKVIAKLPYEQERKP